MQVESKWRNVCSTTVRDSTAFISNIKSQIAANMSISQDKIINMKVRPDLSNEATSSTDSISGVQDNVQLSSTSDTADSMIDKVDEVDGVLDDVKDYKFINGRNIVSFELVAAPGDSPVNKAAAISTLKTAVTRGSLVVTAPGGGRLTFVITSFSDQPVDESTTLVTLTAEPESANKQRLYHLRCMIKVAVLFALLSVAWEFVRLYQHEVAKKASVTFKGIPAECLPEQMTSWQSLKSWVTIQVSWDHDPCEKYHRAMMVSPIWEINPLMAVSSAFSRCVAQPLEIAFETLGRCMKLFFSEIPAQWQLVMMVFIILLALVSTLMVGYMVCRYKKKKERKMKK